MSIPRKRRLFQRLSEDPLLYEIVIAIAAAVAAIVEIISDSKKESTEKRVIITCALVIFACTVLKQWGDWRKKSRDESPHELQGCLETLHAIMLSTDESVLRITIHVPVLKSQELEQIMDYVGDPDETRHTSGRRFPIERGIAGKAFRCKEAIFAERINDDYAAYRSELVSAWGFTEEAAKKCNPEAKSWFAIPLESGSNNKVEGVIYFESSRKGFFAAAQQDTALRAAAGIAKFIQQRY